MIDTHIRLPITIHFPVTLIFSGSVKMHYRVSATFIQLYLDRHKTSNSMLYFVLENHPTKRQYCLHKTIEIENENFPQTGPRVE